MESSIRDILLEIGYSNIRDFGKNYRTKPIYRDSNNNTSLCVCKETGRFIDFSANLYGSLEDLVKLSLNLKDISEAKKWLGSKIDVKSLERKEDKNALGKYPRVFSKNLLNSLMPVHDYWINRGISKETLEFFKGGTVYSGQMAGRYVFPIFSKEKIIGFAGRDTFNNSERIKWKLLGDKAFWMFPMENIDESNQKNEELIILESLGDCLSLWEAGIRNTLVLFGIKLQKNKIKEIIKRNYKKIIISLNNDAEQEENIGFDASCYIKMQLMNFYDENQILIRMPTKKDFGEMSKEEILNWKKQN